jgi:hypothetical protein
LRYSESGHLHWEDFPAYMTYEEIMDAPDLSASAATVKRLDWDRLAELGAWVILGSLVVYMALEVIRR